QGTNASRPFLWLITRFRLKMWDDRFAARGKSLRVGHGTRRKEGLGDLINLGSEFGLKLESRGSTAQREKLKGTLSGGSRFHGFTDGTASGSLPGRCNRLQKLAHQVRSKSGAGSRERGGKQDHRLPSRVSSVACQLPIVIRRLKPHRGQ